MKKLKQKKRKQIVLKDLKCPFGGNPDLISYKDVYKLKKYITTRGRLLPRSRTGVSTICQRRLAREIKRARFMALLPFNNYG